MKKLISLSAIVFTLLAFSGYASQAATQPGKLDNIPMLENKIDKLVNQYLALDIFSGVVLVAEKGEPVYHKAFGLANREKNTPNTVNTLFDIGSMNKTFTSIVVRQLIHEGKLNYDDKLTKYIPGFVDPDAEKITVYHLLHHESGFGTYHGPEYFQAPKSKKTIAAIIERAKRTKLFFAPGTDNMYSNTGYILLGGIIEKVTGKSYFQNVRERIVKPLNLQHTHLQNLERFEDNTAYGYLKNPFGDLMRVEIQQDLPNPDGGFLSTAMDIMKFYRSYFYDDILLNEDVKKNDPYFKMIRELPPGKAPLFAGGYEGHNTAIFQVVSDDITIIVFANMDEPVAENLAAGILDITRGNTPGTPALPAREQVVIALEEKGYDYVKENFDALTTNFHPTDPKDMILNSVGYAYLYEMNDPDKAIEVFKLNTELFPDAANVWDSLGEAHMLKGNKEKALKYYKKALELDPSLPSAMEMVEKLSGK